MLANKLPSWSYDGWVSTSVMSLGGNRNELLGGGIVSFGLGSHGRGEVYIVMMLLSGESIFGISVAQYSL